MNEYEFGLQKEQALLTAPQNGAEVNNEMEVGNRKAGNRNGNVIGCFLYALFYTICLYHNGSGITYPFFVVGSLLFLSRYLKKYGSTAAKENKWIAFSMVLLGLIQCTTTSWVVIICNRFMIWTLGIVILLRVFWQEKLIDGGMFEWITHIAGVAFLSVVKGFWIFSDVWDEIQEKMETRQTEKPRNWKNFKAVIMGLVIACPLLGFLLIMLSSADILFQNMLTTMIDKILYPEWMDWLADVEVVPIGWMIFSIAFVIYGLGKVFMASEEETESEEERPRQKVKLDPLTGYIVIGTVVFVYVCFCLIQIFGLFLGQMTLPEGYTYAQYAREGFFQIAFLCGLNIVMVLVAIKRIANNPIMKALLLVVSACTYLMIASSAFKMGLYIKAYQFTFLRLAVLWALFIMIILMSRVAIYVVKGEGSLVRFFFVILLVAYCIFVLARPDFWIAKYNMTTRNWSTLDVSYMVNDLSYDAVPVWIEEVDQLEIPKSYRILDFDLDDNGDYQESQAVLRNIIQDKDEMGIRTFNFSTYRAGKLAEKKLEAMGVK